MQQMNPGIAKGYALDFASPLRYTAEALNAGPRTLDELLPEYEHDADDLSRVWDHELRKRGQRKSAREEVQAERHADAKRWLLEAAVAAFGSQVSRNGDLLALAVPLEELRVQGLPLVMPSMRAEGESEAPRRVREPKSRRAPVRRRRAPEPSAPEPKPDPPNPLGAWAERNGYSEERLALALELKRSELASYLAGEQAVPRVVWLALWALERGAEV